MKLFSFFKAAKPIERDPKDDIASVLRYAFVNWGNVVPLEATIKAQSALCHPIIFRCVHRIASTVQGVDWYVQKVGNKNPEKRVYQSDAEKSLSALIHNPTNDLSESQFRYIAALNLAIFGNLFIKVGVDPFKKTPNGLYPLLTDKVNNRQSRGQIVGYTIWTPNGEIDLPTRQMASAGKAYAGHIFRPTLDYVNKTHSPLQSLGFAPDIASALMERARELAYGVPNLKHIIFAERDVGSKAQDEFVDAVQARKVGGDEAGNILFLSGLKLDLKTLNSELADLHTKIPLDDMTRQIAAAFGVPIPLLGLAAADSAKYAGNYSEARLSFIEDTIIPDYLSLLEDGLTRMICPPDYEIKFDLDSIESIRRRRYLVAKDLSDVSFLTIDEKRSAIGYAELPNGAGAVLEQPKPKDKKPKDDGDKPDSDKSLPEINPPSITLQ